MASVLIGLFRRRYSSSSFKRPGNEIPPIPRPTTTPFQSVLFAHFQPVTTQLIFRSDPVHGLYRYIDYRLTPPLHCPWVFFDPPPHRFSNFSRSFYFYTCFPVTNAPPRRTAKAHHPGLPAPKTRLLQTPSPTRYGFPRRPRQNPTLSVFPTFAQLRTNSDLFSALQTVLSGTTPSGLLH